MALEDTLLNYGILGIWTVTLLIERRQFQNKVAGLIENNTIALTKCSDAMNSCPYKEKK